MLRAEHRRDSTLLAALSAQQCAFELVQGLPERGAYSASSPPGYLALWPSISMVQESWKQVVTWLAL